MKDAVSDFQSFVFPADGDREVFFIESSGPGVLILHELPGMTPACLDLGRAVAEAGFSVYLPLLFGKPGERLGKVKQLCIYAEWNRLSKRQATPLTEWVRALGREIHSRCGGKGIGAIGMCLTGGFVIPLLLDSHLLAPVACQPSLPGWPPTKAIRRSLGYPQEVLNAAAERLSRTDLILLGHRFERDVICPREKVDAMSEVFGDHFVLSEHPGSGHAVLTDDLRPEALTDTIEFFRRTLL